MEQRKNETIKLDILDDNENGSYNIVNNYSDSDIEEEIENLTKDVDLESNASAELDVEIEDENQGLLEHNNENDNEDSSETLQNSIVENRPKPEKRERQYWIDALRIVSSYMVVLVHCSSYGIYEIELFTLQWYGLMFWDAMSRACVPLFIMISGILFLNPEKEIPLSKLYKKYIYRIIKNIIFWNIFYGTIVKYLINAFGFEYKWGYSLITDFINDLLFGEFHIWYLYMCAGLYIVTPLIRQITKNNTSLKYFLILGFVLVQFIPFITSLVKNLAPKYYGNRLNILIDKFMIFLVTGYTNYYALGYYLNKIEIKKKSTFSIIYILGFINLMITYAFKIIFSVLNQEEFNYYGEYNTLNVFIVAVSAFIFFKYVVSNILNILFRIKGFKSFLLTLSDLSFGVYLIHIFYFYTFRVLKFNSYTFNPFIFSPIHALCIWISSAITVYFMKKIPILRNFV